MHWNLIVFAETGLFVGFFLPGDSLLVTAGLVANGAGWNLPLLLGTLCAAAIIGDSIGYSIGYRTGPHIFNREKSWLFRKDHLLPAHAFYRHGGKTVVLARFMPVVRTFAPVVAGVGRMNYPRFLIFNIVGGIGWVTSMILLGYFLPTVIDPIFKRLLGGQFDVKDHVEKVIIVVVLLSISPGIFAWLRARLKNKNGPRMNAMKAARMNTDGTNPCSSVLPSSAEIRGPVFVRGLTHQRHPITRSVAHAARRDLKAKGLYQARAADPVAAGHGHHGQWPRGAQLLPQQLSWPRESSGRRRRRPSRVGQVRLRPVQRPVHLRHPRVAQRAGRVTIARLR